MPISAIDSIVSILVNKPLAPRYSLLKLAMKKVRTSNPNKMLETCAIIPNEEFFIEFSTLPCLFKINSSFTKFYSKTALVSSLNLSLKSNVVILKSVLYSFFASEMAKSLWSFEKSFM